MCVCVGGGGRIAFFLVVRLLRDLIYTYMSGRDQYTLEIRVALIKMILHSVDVYISSSWTRNNEKRPPAPI